MANDPKDDWSIADRIADRIAKGFSFAIGGVGKTLGSIAEKVGKVFGGSSGIPIEKSQFKPSEKQGKDTGAILDSILSKLGNKPKENTNIIETKFSPPQGFDSLPVKRTKDENKLGLKEEQEPSQREPPQPGRLFSNWFGGKDKSKPKEAKEKKQKTIKDMPSPNSGKKPKKGFMDKFEGGPEKKTNKDTKKEKEQASEQEKQDAFANQQQDYANKAQEWKKNKKGSVGRVFDNLASGTGSSPRGFMGAGKELANSLPMGMGKPIAQVFKFGESLFSAKDKLDAWSQRLHDVDRQFAQFSASMAQVMVEREVRDIQLSQERGNRRAASSREREEQVSRTQRAWAPIEDRFAASADKMNSFLQKISENTAEVLSRILGIRPEAVEQANVPMGQLLQSLADVADSAQTFREERNFGIEERQQ